MIHHRSQQLPRARATRPAPRLTARQIDVLARIADGMTEPQIGAELYLTRDTVATHARRLYRALGARNRAHAVALAYRHGLLPVPAVQEIPRVLPYRRRAVQPDGIVHAARFAGDAHHFTTACAVYPAPAVDRLEHTPDLPVTCTGCLAAQHLRTLRPEGNPTS